MPELTNSVAGISYTSIQNVGTQYRELSIPKNQMGQAVGEALKISNTRGYLLVRGILSSAESQEQAMDEAKNLVQWCRTQDHEAHKVTARAIRMSSGSLLFVNEVAAMPRTDARQLLAAHFETGGSMRDVAQWLAIAGGVLHKHRIKGPDTAGAIVDTVTGWVEDAVDTVSEAVETIIDAVVNAGKTVAELISEVISWSIDQVADLVEALIEAGEKIADLLSSALEGGIELVRKFVRGLIQAGQKAADILNWAKNQAFNILTGVLTALQAAGEKWKDLVMWAAGQVSDVIDQFLQAAMAVGRSVVNLLTAAFEASQTVLRAVAQAFLRIGQTIATLFQELYNRPWALIGAVVTALMEIGNTISDLFNAVVSAGLVAVTRMAQALITIGQTINDILIWGVNRAKEIAAAIVDGLMKAGQTIASLLAAAAGLAREVLRTALGGLLELGRNLRNMVREMLQHGIDALSELIAIALELGTSLAEFISYGLSWTYQQAARLVDGMIRAGIAAAEILTELGEATYFKFRRFINAIYHALPDGVKQVLDWVLESVGTAASVLWRKALLALRFAGAMIEKALDWAADKGGEIFTLITNAWRSIGESLTRIYQWGINVAASIRDSVLALIGEAASRLKLSISFLLLFVKTNLFSGLRSVARGLATIAGAITGLVAFIATRTVDLAVEIVTGILDAGIEIAALLAEAATRPDQAFDKILDALRVIGRLPGEILANAAEAGSDILEKTTQKLYKMGEGAMEILEGAAEIGGGALGTVISTLMAMLASYRPMTPEERMDAELVFGDRLDLDKIYLSTESLTNDIIFSIQSKFNNGSTRPFVTNTLINFRPSEGIRRHTLIHELMHVWQALVDGPLYLSEAIHAQTLGDGYNYGYESDYDDPIDCSAGLCVTIPTDHAGGTVTLSRGDGIGFGAESALTAANNDLNSFNPEQQAQVIMHYFVRRHLLNQNADEFNAWLPYAEFVRS